MSLNKDSNGFIIMFLMVMAVAVAVSLAFLQSVFSPLISKNEEVDTKKQILKTVMDIKDMKNDEILAVFDRDFTQITISAVTGNDTVVIDEKGDTLTAYQLADYNEFKKELRKDTANIVLPLFVYEPDGAAEKNYIFPMTGLGLWDVIWGYMALDEDMSTIVGASFDHKGETPGLGARIADAEFQERFKSTEDLPKELFDPDGKYDFNILKGEGNPEPKVDPHYVDGLSGATITAEGTNDMIKKVVGYYTVFFEKS